MKRVFVYILLLLMLPLSVAGRDNISFRRFSVNDGLSQNTVRAIAQDALGNIWLGTQNGLNRYDGYTIQRYFANSKDSTSLSDNTICSLFYSNDGPLWIGTTSSLSCFDFSKNHFHNYPTPHGVHIFKIKEDGGGRLVLASNDGLWFFDPRTQVMEPVPCLEGYQIRDIFPTEGAILIATNKGLCVYSGKDDIRWVDFFKDKDISSLAQIGGTGWWVGSHGMGLWRTDSEFTPLRHFGKNDDSLPSAFIRVLQTDAFGRLWVGTYNGLAIYDDLSGRFSLYFHDDSPSSLAQNSIWSIFVDSMKGVWVGTWFGGAHYWNRHSDKVRVLPISGTGVYGFVSCLAQDPATDDVWIGTNDDGLFRYDAASGKIMAWKGAPIASNIKCIVPDGPDRMFIGSHLDGLVLLDIRRQKVLKRWGIGAGSLINDGCYCLLKNEDGSYIAGTPGGLMLFSPSSGLFRRHPLSSSEPRLANVLVSQLLRDREGRVWIGTDGGLFRIEKDGVSVCFFEDMDKERDIAVSCLMEGSDGAVYIAANRGLYRYVEDSFTKFTSEDGLPNDYVCALLEDSSSRLWISTGAGICSVRPQDWEFIPLRTRDSNEYTVGAACQGRDGTFHFGGLSGITRFRPLDQGGNPFSPLAYIKDVTATGGEKARIQRDSYGNITQVTIPPGTNTISIQFSVANFLSESNHYRYYLEGFDKHAHETAMRSVVYANLPTPGDYTLHLNAANSDGLWARDDVRMELRIQPHWWQTVWARLLFFLMAVLLVGLSVWFAINRVRMQMQLQVERLERQQIETSLIRTRELLMHSYSADGAEGKDAAETADEAFLKKAIQVVEENIDNEAFSSQDFAEAMNMSRSNLYLKITSVTGESAIQFIRRIRLTRACQMLLEHRYSIAEISTKVGFASPSYFSTAFRKFVGCSPAEYLKKQ